MGINGIYGILNVSKDALLAQQKGIDVTGHNIANVNTPGYSRQRAILQTNPPLSATPGQVGTGVHVSEVERVHDRFLQLQITSETSASGRWEAEKGSLERVEMLFEGYRIDEAMSAFWSGWEDLANNPGGQAERTALVQKAQLVVDDLNGLTEDIVSYQEKDLGQSIAGTVDQINVLTEEIARLNQVILEAEGLGQNANDSRDKRDTLITDLASYLDVTVVEHEDGNLSIFAGNGRALVENASSSKLTAKVNLETGLTDTLFGRTEGQGIDITGEISAGKLAGWRQDAVFEDFLGRLDTFAATLIEEVNALHKDGYGLTTDPDTGLPVTDQQFFTGTSAANIALNAAIVEDANLIAAAQSPDGVPGDNSNAIAIASLRDSRFFNGDTSTFSSYYASLVSDVGSSVYKATFYNDHVAATLSQLNTYRETISGVSIDEEMVSLLQYQHAYQASAKVIQMVDELLDALLNIR